jgi:hypothetical protein
MSRVAFILSLVVLTFAAVEHSGAATSSDSLPNYVAPRYRPAIASWLTRHPGYRVAIDADCTCDDDIAQMRAGYSADWPGVPNYHPYYMVGDFRGDGAADVAVGVISQQHPRKFRVLIIHGTPPKGPAAKTFLSEELDFHQGLFYGPPRPKPWSLVVGPFESDGVTFEPTPTAYKFSSDDD